MNEIKNNGINSITSNSTNTTSIKNEPEQFNQTSQPSQSADDLPEYRVNHDEDVLIDNSVSFFGLVDHLRGIPEALKAEREELKRKEAEKREEELRTIFGENYSDYVTEEDEQEDSLAEDTAGDIPEYKALKKMTSRPGPLQLWNKFHRVAVKKIESGGQIDVYESGYAVYDNGDRRTVLWVPDCGSTIYYFAPLREADKGHIKQKETIGEDVFGPLPWYQAIVIAGEDSIERNIEHPKSAGTASQYDDIEEYAVPEQYWQCCGHIDTPEEAFWKAEAERERREALTEKQREVYILHYIEGYTQVEIAEKLGISQRAVAYRLEGVEKKLKNIS